VVLAYLGAVANKFIYSQWERKGMNTGSYFSGHCSKGPKANVLHSAVRILLLFLNCRFTLMSVFNRTVHAVPSQSNNMRQAR
jgi:hypothetical protein